MLVVLASESEFTASSFRPLDRSDSIELLQLSLNDVRTWIRERAKHGEQREKCLFYVDVSGLAATERTRLIRYLVKSSVVFVGICDPAQNIEDPARWFHEGIVDYLPESILEAHVKPTRVKMVLKFAQGPEVSRDEFDRTGNHTFEAAADVVETGSTLSQTAGGIVPVGVDTRIPDRAPHGLAVKESPRDWKNLQTGREYTFGVLHIMLDVPANTIRDTSVGFINSSIDAFQDAIMEIVGPHGGRLWFWKEYSGVILFPYDGLRCDAILAAMRIMLRRIFWQAEHKTNYITKHFRMSLHLGNLVYEEGGSRETLVSDLVNYLFHLGTKFTNPGEFVFTADIGHCCPQGLRSCFVHQGTYRDHEIWRMRRLLTPREASVIASS